MSHWLFPRARARQIKTCNRFPFQGGFASGFVSKAADACKAKMLVVFVYLLSCWSSSPGCRPDLGAIVPAEGAPAAGG